MNIDKNNLTTYINKSLSFVQQHTFFLGIVGFGIIYGYIIVQVSGLTAKEPDPTKVTEQLKTVPRPKIDPEIAKKIENLESENINVQVIFDQARENPFSE